MLYGVGYVIGEKGEKYWKDNLEFDKLTPLQISEKEMDSLRKDFYDHHHENFLEIDEYLVNGNYFKFMKSDKEKLLVIKGNSKESLEKIAQEFNLPINKANLSAQPPEKIKLKNF